MPASKMITRDRAVKQLIDKLEARNSALKSTINRMLTSWNLNIDVTDGNQDLEEALSISSSKLIDLPVEDLFKYQWELSRFALFLSVQSNKLKSEYSYDLKPLYDDLIKKEAIKLKSGSMEDKKIRVLNANPKLKEISMMLDISKAYSEILYGLSDRVIDMKNVLNRIIDKKALDYKFGKSKNVKFRER